MALSDNIRNAREQRGVSQELVAEKLGVSRQAVFKWETGQAEPSPQNLLQLAEFLKVDTNILLNESPDQKVFSAENIEQTGIRTFLNQRNAIFLISSCTAQMFAWSINPGQIDLFKYSLVAISFLFMVLLLYNIWFKTGRATRIKLLARVIAFSVIFNIVVGVGCSITGGFVSLFAGIVLMLSGLKIAQ